MTGFEEQMRVRKDIRLLEKDWKHGTLFPNEINSAAKRKPLENLVRAFKGIQELPPENPRSFFYLSSHHGEPFRGAGWSDGSFWGGYCNHGNILFPVWHRAYILELEHALRSIEGCEDVTLPYWNQIDDAMQEHGLPEIFLMRRFPLDGEEVENPLFSYKFQSSVKDTLTKRPGYDYSKYKGYETVRYPFSGLVGENDKAETEFHNKAMKAKGEMATNELLNENLKDWLGPSLTNWNGEVTYTWTRLKYQKCLEAPNYTVFSNTTSATQWNEEHFEMKELTQTEALEDSNGLANVVVPLETPHNSIHLAVGGFELPAGRNVNSTKGANGDMGENNTAAFDPLFFFHHCFIDMMFWLWQKHHNRTEFLDIIEKYPGTVSNDGEGTPAGVARNTWLNMESPLEPFRTWKYAPANETDFPEHLRFSEILESDDKPVQELRGLLPRKSWEDVNGVFPPIPCEWPIQKWPEYSWPPAQWPPKVWPHFIPVVAKDMVNILKLGYIYDEGSVPVDLTKVDFSTRPQPSIYSNTQPAPILRTPEVVRSNIAGSFYISIWANGSLVDVHPVLSRWHVQGCANCQTHLKMRCFVTLHGWTLEQARKTTFTFYVHTRRSGLQNCEVKEDVKAKMFGQMVTMFGTSQKASHIRRVPISRRLTLRQNAIRLML